MLRIIQRLRPIIPAPLWKLPRDAYWRWFWRREEREEEKELGKVNPQPIAGSERAVLVERIADYYPFSSLLEVGCAYGQNFFVIGKQYPGAKFLGVDSSPTCVEEGRRLLKRDRLENVQLEVADARSLKEIADKSFDLVISCAFFLYLRPEEAKRAAAEMLRIAQRGVLLLEQHQPSAEDQRVLRENAQGGYWLRDYRRLFEEIVSAERITIQSVPNPRWHIERWHSFGSLIEVKL